jgi:mediator of RNA polymerase II transcription subunit 12
LPILGYLGFHPPRPGQDEDLLTDSNVKQGFILGSQVNVRRFLAYIYFSVLSEVSKAETFSAQSILNIEDATLCRLEALMNEVFIRRADAVPTIP